MAVVGASGVVFGLAGATVADMGANFETLRRPLLRTALLLAFLVFFAVTVGAWVEGCGAWMGYMQREQPSAGTCAGVLPARPHAALPGKPPPAAPASSSSPPGNTATGTSHMSHVGGFLAGLGAGLAALPNLHRTRCETAATALGAAGALAMFVALPCLFYLRVLPGLTC